ncbi:MAG: hypothetical protein FWC61_02820 [Proteobacteria bacterium]|nr:hypothetical protein [Pseudomonadota bacterium]
MKTKIIYISGGEVFAPGDVRAAFEEVRKMLNMDADTVVFGVPVDSDDIGAARADIMAINKSAPINATPDELPWMPADGPRPPAQARTPATGAEKGRARKKKDDVAAQEPADAAEEKPSSAPILSVLGAVQSGKPEPEIVIVAEEIAEDAEITTTTTTVSEIITIETKTEKAPTIEDIFAELEPLKEDKIVDFAPDKSDAAGTAADIETDETLSKMAEEFAAAQKDIPETPAARGSKIGKLKNILPFKKAKKDDPSIFGDLFGWAGIAANDDDERFALPDFFRAGNGN